MLIVQGLGFCFLAHATTSSKAQAVGFKLLTTQTSSSCCTASNTVILVVQVSGNKTIFLIVVSLFVSDVAVVATE